jgi:thymidylate kinase
MFAARAVPGTGAPLVEIAGPPGAGKSTLMSLLADGAGCIRGVRSLRSVGYAPCFAGTAVRVLPKWVPGRTAHGLGWRELGIIVHLEALPHALPHARDGETVMFDQGPVFMLARLAPFLAARTGDARMRGWWQAAVARWASMLGTVIWLDAPNAVLVERIQKREKWHRVKDRSTAEAIDWLERSRQAYAQTLSALTAARHTRVVRYETTEIPPDRLARVILADLPAAADGARM